MTVQGAMMNDAASGSRIPPIGAMAPGFELEGRPGERHRLEDFRGAPLVLFFYPADWSPVCGDQVVLYNEVMGEFTELGAKIVGVSVDGPWCHAAFADKKKVTFPLLADFEPKGEVARKYGVYREGEGMCERAIFIIDGDGVIRWSYVAKIDVNPGAAGIINALERLNEAKNLNAGSEVAR